jgi:hypothetical protein
MNLYRNLFKYLNSYLEREITVSIQRISFIINL